MENQKHSVEKRIHPGSTYLRYFFFAAGVIATIAYRITPFLNSMQIKIAWYVGTIGFILYFAHRSRIEAKRAHLVKDFNLVEAVDKSSLEGDQKVAVSYLVKTSLSSKARYNSEFILWASVIALIAGVLLDLGWLHF